jgi:hypothetical protein
MCKTKRQAKRGFQMHDWKQQLGVSIFFLGSNMHETRLTTSSKSLGRLNSSNIYDVHVTLVWYRQ